MGGVRNRDVRESCIHYTYLALEGWNTAVLERFRIPLQPTIAVLLQFTLSVTKRDKDLIFAFC